MNHKQDPNVKTHVDPPPDKQQKQPSNHLLAAALSKNDTMCETRKVKVQKQFEQVQHFDTTQNYLVTSCGRSYSLLRLYV